MSLTTKSIFRAYNVDFTNELPDIGSKDVLVIDKNVYDIYKSKYDKYEYVFEIDLKGTETAYEDFIIISLVIILIWFTGPDLKYSKERTTIEIIRRVNKENFCLFPLFKKTERADITKSSLPISLDILINTQIRLMKKFPLGLMLCQFQLQHKIKDHQQHLRVNLFP